MPMTRTDWITKTVVEEMFMNSLEDTQENRLSTLYGMLDGARKAPKSRMNTIYVGELHRSIHLLLDQMEIA